MRQLLVLFIFFFQAEDGIRDRTVTGVQTCALPISSASQRPAVARGGQLQLGLEAAPTVAPPVDTALVADADAVARARSEERRVGKECRPWCPRYRAK